MRGVAISTWLLAQAAVAQTLSVGSIASVGGANALSTPAARHMVRMPSGAYLLALQRDGTATQPGLSFYRSDDDGGSWRFYRAINSIARERQTADLLAVGGDVAMVQSYDAPSLLPDATLDPSRKVWFQWWRGGAGEWQAEAPVAVFEPALGEAYHRGEVAVDSAGRIWVQAFSRGGAACNPSTDAVCKLCDTVDNGDNYANEMVVSVSTDGGRTFSSPQILGSTLCRAGGRLIDLGDKLMLIWNDYSANENGTRVVTRFVERGASDPLASWSAPQDAFPDKPWDGIYHGAALSAVADGAGGMHLVYKDQNDLLLWYRYFDGAAFGAAVQVDDSRGDWALQPAVTRRGDDLFVFDNHLTLAGRYETRHWRLSSGLGPGRAMSLDDGGPFYGYPASPEQVPAESPLFPYAFASTPDQNSPGEELALRIATDPPGAQLSATPAALRTLDGESLLTTLMLAPRNGYRGPMTLSMTGVPAGASASLTQEPISMSKGPAAVALSVAPGDAPAGDYRLVVTAASPVATTSATVSWTIARTPPSDPGDPSPQSGSPAGGGGGGCASAGGGPLALAGLGLLLRRRRRGVS